MARECWFCGKEATDPWRDRVIGFHRDVDHAMTRWIVVIRTTWQIEVLSVPRCARCHGGHRIEQAMMVLAIAAVLAYAASGQLDELLGILPSTSGDRTVATIWAVITLLPTVVWIAIRQAWVPWERLAPRRLRHARHHPGVLRLREDGWRFRPGPFPHWQIPRELSAQPPPTRPRRRVGTIIALLGIASFVTTIVLYFQDYSELAGGFLLAAGGLFYLAAKIDPEI